MLRALELVNFKGIGKRQRIELRPLTLLFGPNNAGKSTILHALLYLREVIEHGSADVDRTELGGSVLELGGFRRLVHGHERERTIVLRAEFDTPAKLDRFDRDLEGFPLPDLDDNVDGAWIELAIQWHQASYIDGPVVSRAAIGCRGEAQPLVQLELLEMRPTTAKTRAIRCSINFEHPLLSTEGEDAENTIDAWRECAWLDRELFQVSPRQEKLEKPSLKRPAKARGTVGHGTRVFAIQSTRHSALPSLDQPLAVIPPDETDDLVAPLGQLRAFLEMVIVGTTSQLLQVLRDALYVGPLRTIPPRECLFESPGNRSSWADGLAAWKALLVEKTSPIVETNRWLLRLDAGCEVVVQKLLDSSAPNSDDTEHSDWSVRRLLLKADNGTLVLPSELGAGISQVVPIIVAASTPFARLGLFEQPELHVHPALQVGLGDLFIETVTRKKKRKAVVVETHSEHLLLRVLKRIRETSEGNLPSGVLGFTTKDLSVIYVDSQEDAVKFKKLRVDEMGEFIDRWPRGFFEERMGEVF